MIPIKVRDAVSTFEKTGRLYEDATFIGDAAIGDWPNTYTFRRPKEFCALGTKIALFMNGTEPGDVVCSFVLLGWDVAASTTQRLWPTS